MGQSQSCHSVINPCISFSPLFRMAFLHPNRIFQRIFRNTTDIEMTCTLLIASFFTKIALWYQHPWEKTSKIYILHSTHQSVGPLFSQTMLTVFLAGITAALQVHRNSCADCHRNAPSQPNAPSLTCPGTRIPEYPFQCICTDHFNYQGAQDLVAVDQCSSQLAHNQKGPWWLKRIDCLNYLLPIICNLWHPRWTCFRWWTRVHSWYYFHFPAELGSQPSSIFCVAFPHSNCRSKVAVETAKRLNTSYIWANGSLDTDPLQWAILQDCNTPNPPNRTFICNVSLWTTHWRFHPNITCLIWTSSYLDWYTQQKRRSSKELSYENFWKMVPSHWAIATTLLPRLVVLSK